MQTDNFDSYPLPEADRTSELETLSLHALNAALPVKRFRFRDERVDDAGVDGSIELKSNGRSTNLRSQVQLKATDSEKCNQDGSFSLQIKTSNLHYLLNGPCPIYILYIAPLDELRFVWAHDERKRLDDTNPQWNQQEKVTLYFRNLLDPSALDAIYQRIGREGQMYRQTRETLDRATSGERVRITYDPTTLAQTGPEDAERQLSDVGMVLVAIGKAPCVLELSQSLSRTSTRQPRIQLILAYAAFHMGRFEHALGHLSEAALRRHDLVPDDNDFLTFMKDACEFHTGRIDLSEYSRRQQSWGHDQSGGLALSHQLECVRRTLLAQDGAETDSETLSELRSVVSKILSLPEASKEFKMQARVALMYHDGMEDIHALQREVSDLLMRKRMNLPNDLSRVGHLLTVKVLEWEEQIEKVLQEAWAAGNPLVIGDVLTTQVSMCVFRHWVLRAHWDKDENSNEGDDSHIALTITRAEKAIEIYQRVENLDAELRVTILLADLLELKGETSKAKGIAMIVLAQAEAMGYRDHAIRARQHTTDQTVLARAKVRREQNAQADPDVIDANVPDVNLRAVAKNLMRAMNLPAERYPVFERDVFAHRAIARERLHWCRHIELLQDLRHRRNPATHYLTDPNRHCLCRKHKLETKDGNTDPYLVIQSFKDAICSGCSDRQPKENTVFGSE